MGGRHDEHLGTAVWYVGSKGSVSNQRDTLNDASFDGGRTGIFYPFSDGCPIRQCRRLPLGAHSGALLSAERLVPGIGLGWDQPSLIH